MNARDWLAEVGACLAFVALLVLLAALWIGLDAAMSAYSPAAMS